MFSHPDSFFRLLLRMLVRPQVMLTLVVVWVAEMVFRADLWLDDVAIVNATVDNLPKDHWLPRQLWALSAYVAEGEAWAYQIWNVLALWATSLGVYKLMRAWLEESFRVSVWLRSPVSVLAGVLCALHPVASMTACSVGHLDWQLATLCGLLSVLAARAWWQRPGLLPLGGLAGSFLLAVLSAPAALLLGVGGVGICWALASQIERTRARTWLAAGPGGRIAAGGVGCVLVLGLAIHLNILWQRYTGTTSGLTWSTHWLTQGHIFWEEIRSLLIPLNLLPSHTVIWSHHWTDWQSVSGLLLLAALLVLSLCALLRPGHDARRPLYGLILLALWPSVLVLGWRTLDAFAEVRWYAALPWAAMLAAWVVGWITTHWSALKYPLGFAVPACLAFTSIHNLAHFQSSDLIAAQVLQHDPMNLRARCWAAELQAERDNQYGVIQASRPAQEAYVQMLEFNKHDPQGRTYDLVNALRWWVAIEHQVQSAMQKNYGYEYGKAYAANSTLRVVEEVRKVVALNPDAQPYLQRLALAMVEPPPGLPHLPSGIPGITSTLSPEVGIRTRTE